MIREYKVDLEYKIIAILKAVFLVAAAIIIIIVAIEDKQGLGIGVSFIYSLVALCMLKVGFTEFYSVVIKPRKVVIDSYNLTLYCGDELTATVPLTSKFSYRIISKYKRSTKYYLLVDDVNSEVNKLNFAFLGHIQFREIVKQTNAKNIG